MMTAEETIKLKSKRNNVFLQGNHVIKEFVSLEDYNKESLVYDKLSQTQLAPKIIEKHNKCIITEYIEGTTLFDKLETALNDTTQQLHLFKLFFAWYARFRERTGLILGDTHFKNFILTKEESLYGIDFETCRNGEPEEDISWQAAMLATLSPEFSPERISMTRLFLVTAVQTLEISTPSLLQRLEQSFRLICKRREVDLKTSALKEIASCLEIAACLLAGGQSSRMGTDKKLLLFGNQTMLAATAKAVNLFAEKYLSLAEIETNIQMAGFHYVFDQKPNCGPIGGIVSALSQVKQKWTLFVSCDMPMLNREILDYLAAFREDEYDAVLFSENGMRKIFPLLLQTQKAFPALNHALDNDEFTLWRTLTAKLKILEVRIEDCPFYEVSSLQNINTKEDYDKLKNFS